MDHTLLGGDSCGRFVDDEQEVEFCKSLPAVFDKQEMQFRQPLPGDSADTIQLLESAILCPSCYRRLNPAHFSQQLMNNDSAISPKESEEPVFAADGIRAIFGSDRLSYWRGVGLFAIWFTASIKIKFSSPVHIKVEGEN